MRPYGRHQICHRAFHRFQRRQVFEADFYVTKLEIGGERVEELNSLDDEDVLHCVTLKAFRDTGVPDKKLAAKLTRPEAAGLAMPRGLNVATD